MLRIFVLAVFILLFALLSACGSPSPSLLGTQCQWATVTTGIAQEPIQNPKNYVLIFHEDGNFNGQADCNMISGTYEMDESALTLSIGPTTLAECGHDSLHEGFMGFLKYVERYELKDTRKTLFLSDGSTRLGFKNGGTAE